MTVRRITVRLAGAAIATGGLALMGFGTLAAPIANGVALQSAVGDNNAGDFFLDNISFGPGGETDPHLDCGSILIGGMNLADSSGGFTIWGWPPSGTQETLITGTWAFNTITGGTQQLASVSAATLVADAIAAGDTLQPEQGYHFKIQVSQDPTKYKTFWLSCAVGTTTTSTTSSTPGSSTSSSSTTTTTSAAPGSSTTITSTTTTPVVGGPATSTAGLGGGVSTGVRGAGTATPSTGADVDFGVGLAMLALGGGMIFGAKRFGRKNGKNER